MHVVDLNAFGGHYVINALSFKVFECHINLIYTVLH